MRSHKLLVCAEALLFALLSAAESHANGAIALTGQVSSQKEKAMEGVVVGAKKEGSTVTINVVSDAKGRFAFPSEKLEPGHYALKVRAAGYDLDGPTSIDVTAGKTATANLKLKAAENPSAQLTDAEWLLSIPGTEQQKNFLLGCNSCHTIERIVKANKSADEWVQVFRRMSTYSPGSTPLRPQVTVGGVQRDRTRGVDPMEIGTWLANVNASYNSKQSFPLKTLPRPKGKATRTIITEYDLPRKLAMPHDVIVDGDGMVWYSDFGDQFIGRLDPKTGKVTDFPIPELKKGFPLGTLDLQSDKEQNLWVSLMYQGGIAKFDRKTEKFQIWQLPPERLKDDSQLNMVTNQAQVDGKVWVNDAGPSTLLRLDLATGKFEEFDPLSILPGGRQGGYSIYDVRADSRNNVYVTDFQKNYVVKVDAKTGKLTAYQTGTPFSRNRRGRIDDQDRFWFAEYRGNKIAMLDTKEERIQELTLPTKFTLPYDVIWDKDGNLWTGGMTTDRVVRLDPKNGEAVEYPLPRDTNMRRMFVDNSTMPPTFWVGSNHGASIVRVEPLD